MSRHDGHDVSFYPCTSMFALRPLLFGLFLAITLSAAGPWDIDAIAHADPQVEWIDSSGPLRSLTFAGETYKGHPTRVFAYYAPPQGVDGPAPGVVLVHGGGGTAFREWAYMWGQRGYHAIAMDLGGRGENRSLLPNGGPDQVNQEKFVDIALGLENAWTYHAVANVIRATTVLQQQPGVDTDRIGLTGISWGGYLTSILVGVDDRIRAAVPVYGCGFIYLNSPWVENIDALTPELRKSWIENFDPSQYLPHSTAPTLWLTRTHDFHYRMDNYQRGYRLARGPQTLSITTDREHSHAAGMIPPEIPIFFDHHLRGQAPLATVGETKTEGQQVRAAVHAEVRIAAAELAYTYEDPTSHESKWLLLPGQTMQGQATATLPQPRPTAYFLIVTDERGARVSSPCVGCSND